MQSPTALENTAYALGGLGYSASSPLVNGLDLNRHHQHNATKQSPSVDTFVQREKSATYTAQPRLKAIFSEAGRNKFEPASYRHGEQVYFNADTRQTGNRALTYQHNVTERERVPVDVDAEFTTDARSINEYVALRFTQTASVVNHSLPLVEKGIKVKRNVIESAKLLNLLERLILFEHRKTTVTTTEATTMGRVRSWDGTYGDENLGRLRRQRPTFLSALFSLVSNSTSAVYESTTPTTAQSESATSTSAKIMSRPSGSRTSSRPETDFESRRRRKTHHDQRKTLSVSALDDVINLLESSRRLCSRLRLMTTEGRVKSSTKRLTRKFDLARSRLVNLKMHDLEPKVKPAVAVSRLRLMSLLLSEVRQSLRRGKHVITLHSGRADYNRLVRLVKNLNGLVEEILRMRSKVPRPKTNIGAIDSSERRVNLKVATGPRSSAVAKQQDSVGVLFVDVSGQRILMTMNVSEGEKRSLELRRTSDSHDMIAAGDWAKMSRTFGIKQELSQQVGLLVYDLKRGGKSAHNAAWTQWSSWSELADCWATPCGQPAVRTRHRLCVSVALSVTGCRPVQGGLETQNCPNVTRTQCTSTSLLPLSRDIAELPSTQADMESSVSPPYMSCLFGNEVEEQLKSPKFTGRCVNGGRCINSGTKYDQYRCVCPNGHYGDYCETEGKTRKIVISIALVVIVLIILLTALCFCGLCGPRFSLKKTINGVDDEHAKQNITKDIVSGGEGRDGVGSGSNSVGQQNRTASNANSNASAVQIEVGKESPSGKRPQPFHVESDFEDDENDGVLTYDEYSDEFPYDWIPAAAAAGDASVTYRLTPVADKNVIEELSGRLSRVAIKRTSNGATPIRPAALPPEINRPVHRYPGRDSSDLNHSVHLQHITQRSRPLIKLPTTAESMSGPANMVSENSVYRFFEVPAGSDFEETVRYVRKHLQGGQIVGRNSVSSVENGTVEAWQTTVNNDDALDPNFHYSHENNSNFCTTDVRENLPLSARRGTTKASFEYPTELIETVNRPGKCNFMNTFVREAGDTSTVNQQDDCRMYSANNTQVGAQRQADCENENVVYDSSRYSSPSRQINWSTDYAESSTRSSPLKKQRLYVHKRRNGMSKPQYFWVKSDNTNNRVKCDHFQWPHGCPHCCMYGSKWSLFKSRYPHCRSEFSRDCYHVYRRCSTSEQHGVGSPRSDVNDQSFDDVPTDVDDKSLLHCRKLSVKRRRLSSRSRQSKPTTSRDKTRMQLRSRDNEQRSQFSPNSNSHCYSNAVGCQEKYGIESTAKHSKTTENTGCDLAQTGSDKTNFVANKCDGSETDEKKRVDIDVITSSVAAAVSKSPQQRSREKTRMTESTTGVVETAGVGLQNSSAEKLIKKTRKQGNKIDADSPRLRHSRSTAVAVTVGDSSSSKQHQRDQVKPDLDDKQDCVDKVNHSTKKPHHQSSKSNNSQTKSPPSPSSRKNINVEAVLGEYETESTSRLFLNSSEANFTNPRSNREPFDRLKCRRSPRCQSVDGGNASSLTLIKSRNTEDSTDNYAYKEIQQLGGASAALPFNRGLQGPGQAAMGRALVLPATGARGQMLSEKGCSNNVIQPKSKTLLPNSALSADTMTPWYKELNGGVTGSTDRQGLREDRFSSIRSKGQTMTSSVGAGPVRTTFKPAAATAPGWLTTTQRPATMVNPSSPLLLPMSVKNYSSNVKPRYQRILTDRGAAMTPGSRIPSVTSSALRTSRSSDMGFSAGDVRGLTGDRILPDDNDVRPRLGSNKCSNAARSIINTFNINFSDSDSF